MDRRTFVKSLSLVAAASILFGVEEISGPKIPDERPKIYTSGDTIDSTVGKIEIEGWKILIDEQEVKRNLGPYIDTDVRISLISPRENLYPQLWVSSEGGYMAMNFSSIKKDGKHLMVFHGLPDPLEKIHAYLFITEWQEGKERRVRTYPISFKFFSDIPKEDLTPPKILSEANLGQNLLNRIRDFQRPFGSFMLEPDMYIFDSNLMNDFYKKSKGADFQPYPKRINLASSLFVDPDSEKEGFMTVYHENSHVIMQGLIDYERDKRLQVKMIKAYENFARAAGFEIPLRFTGNPKENPSFFDIFTESMYLKLKNQDTFSNGFGHPYSNYNELFASSMTIFRFFPEEFAARFQKHKRKKEVAEVVNVVLEILKGINPNRDKIETLLPSYDMVRNLVKEYKS